MLSGLHLVLHLVSLQSKCRHCGICDAEHLRLHLLHPPKEDGNKFQVVPFLQC